MCVSLWLSECVQICAMYDFSGPKLWLWPGESSRLVQKKPFYSVQYTALCMFEIHCVFQPVGKEVSMQYRLSYSGAIILDLRLP